MPSEKVVTGREMRALEINAEYFGVSRLQLMENAGRSITQEIASRFKPKKAKIAVFCGLGGNGGDGFVAARHLACLGFKVEVVVAGKLASILDVEARKNWRGLEPLKAVIPVHEVYDSTLIPDVKVDVVVDALLGFGLKGELRLPVLQLVNQINGLKAFCVAVDVPTGIDSDSGRVLSDAVKADLTVTFHKAKPGLLLPKAKKYVGELVVRDIGLPSEFEAFAGPGDVELVVKHRPVEAHKGHFGRLLVIGGNEIYSGAPALVALAALRTGVDLAYVAAPERTAYALSSLSPNLINLKLEGDHLNPANLAFLRRFLRVANAAVVGPGLGVHKDTKEAVEEVLHLAEKDGIPVLLDADGLKAFAEFKWKFKAPTVLTPHAGEFALLVGKSLPEDLENRVEAVQKAAKELGAVILLKGHVDVVSDGSRVKLNFTGNPGMTVGGTGDVLSGVVGALLAQGVDAFEAAVAGAFVNGAAGDFVQREKGFHMVPTDLLDWIPKALDYPMTHRDCEAVSDGS